MNHHYSCALALRNSELCGHQQHAVGTPMKKGRLGDPQFALFPLPLCHREQIVFDVRLCRGNR